MLRDRAVADAHRLLTRAPRHTLRGPSLPSPVLHEHSERENIGVIGTGYVGLVTAVGFAELGSEVWCIDIDAAKIDRLNRGEVPIFEPGLEEAMARNRERLHFSTDLADALEQRAPAVRRRRHAADLLRRRRPQRRARRRRRDAAVRPPRARHEVDRAGRHRRRRSSAPSREQGKEGFRYVSCPEFLKEGSALSDFLAPDRVVVGDDGDWAGDAVVDLYRPLLTAEHGGAGPGELVRTDVNSAEMVKLAANAFLATKISFINEIANVCEETGADVVEVARGMGLDDRIGPKFLHGGHRLRRQLLPQGRQRAQAARRQLAATTSSS